VEVGKAVFALHFIDAQLDFAEGMFFIFVQVSQRYLDYATLERVVGVLYMGYRSESRNIKK